VCVCVCVCVCVYGVSKSQLHPLNASQGSCTFPESSEGSS